MYRVYSDGLTIYNDRLENLQIFSPIVDLELNKTGSFTFIMYPDHPYYGLIHKLKSIITVYQDDYLLFRGRVLDEEYGFHNEKKIVCEGELAFFLDTIQPPYEYMGTIEGFLNLMVTNHNAQVDESKWFTVGNITVTDPNDTISRSNIDYTDTWTEMQDKLIKLLGGYIVVRHEGYINYIDYVKDFTLLSSQPITFGQNLIDLKRTMKGADIATALLPLGAKLKDEEGKDTDARLTIQDVNGGKLYVQDEEAVSRYGFICRTHVWDDVTEASNLLTKAHAQLAEFVNAPASIDLTAADMATMDASFSSFHLGTYVRVNSPPHGISQNLLVTNLSVKLKDPAANRLTLGGVIPALSGTIAGISSGQALIHRDIEGAVKKAAEAVYNVELNLLSSLTQTAENIRAIVAEEYALKDDTESLVSSVSTALELLKDSFTIEFSSFRADIESIAAGTDAEFEEIRKYIRFTDGKILLGEIGNELELQIANDRISFLQDGAEVAYISNRKLYITDSHFLHSLQIGSFAFLPRANGNLSFKKV